MTNPTSLLMQLVACRSDRSEEALVNLLASILGSWGARVTIQPVHPGRPNLIATLPGRDSSRSLLLEAHSDTVGGDAPYTPVIRDGRLYGRGACDTKGPMSSMLNAIHDVLAAGPPPVTLHFVSTCNEESGATGAHHLVAGGFRADSAVVAEPTDLELVYAHKGALRLRLRTSGVASHSSAPELGVNAIYKMRPVLEALEAKVIPALKAVYDPVLGHPTLSVGVIHGGSQVNIVPATCTLEVDRRMVASETAPDVVTALLEAMPGDVAHEITEYYPPLFQSPDSDLVKGTAAALGATRLATAPWASNAGVFAAAGIPSVLFGPGSIHQAHTTDEFIDLTQLEMAARKIRRFDPPQRKHLIMTPTPLYFVWQYTDRDRAFWSEHFEHWLPRRIIDAHTHVARAADRIYPMTDARRRQHWANEVSEPIDASTAEQCHRTVFPGRELSCVAFGMPDLDYDTEAGNRYLQQECPPRGWHSLAVVRPQWSQEKIAAVLDMPSVIGVKPYYTLISENRDTRDAHLEDGIFDFLPHPMLEVLNDRQSWVTLHVPKARRLGHPDNIREIREIRRRYPKVSLVVAHLGRCYTEPHAREALPQLADDPGLFFDTSAVLNAACHRIALEHFGPKRVLYGSDNPIFYMRGRRQYEGTTYKNRTSHPFHFNQQREAPGVEADYTLFMYEDIYGIKQACTELGLNEPANIAAIFHDNAARLIAKALFHKNQ